MTIKHLTLLYIQGPARRQDVYLRTGFGLVFGRGVAKATARARTQQLLPYRITALHKVFHCHIVSWAQPAVAVAIEKNLAGYIGKVAARGVPYPSVEEHG